MNMYTHWWHTRTVRFLIYLGLFLIASLQSSALAGTTGQNSTGLPLFMPSPLKPKQLPLYYWRQEAFVNFGDYLSLKVVERMVNSSIHVYSRKPGYNKKKLFAIGSILTFASDDDVIWGSGINGKRLSTEEYNFKRLDIRAVRGPLTRQFLMNELHIAHCPEVYGDPALLVPYLFPEFKKKQKPSREYVIIPHYSELHLFPKTLCKNVIYPIEPWDHIVREILNSKLVISSSLHGIVIAEAFGIPARLLKITNNEPLFKYMDYYQGTGRSHFQHATSIEQALRMGGEAPCICDLKKLYEAFPFECWPQAKPKNINFHGNK